MAGSRCFIDLSVMPRKPEYLSDIAFLAARLGYSALGVDCVEHKNDMLREVERESKIRIVCRALIRGENRRAIAQKLHRLPRDHVVVVEAENLDVARYAAVKKRVDIIRLSGRGLAALDRSQARLFKERGWGAIELSLKPVITDPHRNLQRFITAVRKAVAFGIDLIIVSDAGTPEELIPPYSAAGIVSLSGLPGEYALSFISNSPLSILIRRGLESPC